MASDVLSTRRCGYAHAKGREYLHPELTLRLIIGHVKNEEEKAVVGCVKDRTEERES